MSPDHTTRAAGSECRELAFRIGAACAPCGGTHIVSAVLQLGSPFSGHGCAGCWTAHWVGIICMAAGAWRHSTAGDTCVAVRQSVMQPRRTHNRVSCLGNLDALYVAQISAHKTARKACAGALPKRCASPQTGLKELQRLTYNCHNRACFCTASRARLGRLLGWVATSRMNVWAAGLSTIPCGEDG